MHDGADHKADDVYLLGIYKNNFLYLAKETDAAALTPAFTVSQAGGWGLRYTKQCYAIQCNQTYM